MKLLVLADDDMAVRKLGVEPADVVVPCGDVTDSTILEAARFVNAAHILAVKGNHDSSGHSPSQIVDLHLATCEIEGIRFGGFQGAWRYKPVGNFLYDQYEVDELLRDFPPVDAFVAHNSPRHVHDRDDMVHLGFDAFCGYIERARPRLFIHGHQHVNRQTPVSATQVIGVYGHRRLKI